MSFTVRDIFYAGSIGYEWCFFLIGPRLSYYVCILDQTWSFFALIVTKSTSKSPNSTVRSKVRYFCWWHINLKRYISGLYKQCIFYIYNIYTWLYIEHHSYVYRFPIFILQDITGKATFHHVNDGSTQKHLENSKELMFVRFDRHIPGRMCLDWQ